MKTTLCFILLTFVTLMFINNSFAQTVNIIYFLPKDLQAQEGIDATLDSLIKTAQQEISDLMVSHGFGQKTFSFTADNSGNAVVTHVTGEHNVAEYQSNPFQCATEVNNQYDTENNVYFVLLDRQDGSTRGGYGGYHDSGNGGLAVVYSTDTYTAVHELGHAFGLWHDTNADMMTTFCSAQLLNVSQYLNGRSTDTKSTTVSMLPARRSPPDSIILSFEVSDPDGLHQAQLLLSVGVGVLDCIGLSESSQTVEFIVSTSVASRINNRGSLRFYVVDANGFFTLKSYNIDLTDLLPPPTAISIPDTHLAALVRDALNLSAGSEITQLDMLQLITIDPSGNTQVADLTSIEYAKNLAIFRLSSSSISDLSPLSGLTRLAGLSLLSSQVSDVSPLANLTRLWQLSLSNNEISDITPLANLTNLTRLSLTFSQISNIDTLKNMTKLENLRLFHNQISDISALSSLTNLRTLDLRYNQISDVSPLVNLVNLQELVLYGNPITDRSPLNTLQSNNPSLTIRIEPTPVATRTSQVRDAIVAAIPSVNVPNQVTAAHLAAITSLNLRNAGITALKTDDFSGMTALTSINLFDNQLSSLPDGIFAGLTSLTTIRLGRNTVDPIPLMVTLERVAEGQFKAAAPSGAPFDIVLPITIANGSIAGGAISLTIPKGGVESETLTVTRTVGTTAAVTVDIGTLPSLPRHHYGYALVKSDDLPLAVITGINTAPVFTDSISVTRTIAENTATSTNIGTPVAATDTENDTLIYTLSGTDASAFDIDSTTGQLKTKATLDFETKNTYTVTITVSDGSLTDTITVTINVTDIDEVVTVDPVPTNTAPVFTDGSSSTRSVAENTASNVNIGSPITATDADNDTLTYSLGGTEATTFSIDTATGQIKTLASLDYETKSSYTVIITVSDGNGGTDSISVSINVTDVNEQQTSTTTYNVGDNITTLPSGFWIPDVTANGASFQFSSGQVTITFNNEGYIEEDDITYTCVDAGGCEIVNGAVTKGTIEASTGDVVPPTPPTPVTNSAPMFSEGTSATRSVAENTASAQNIGTPVDATDTDGHTLTYTLGGTEASAFDIDSTTGQLKTKAALDYETKNTYAVTITVSDGSLTDTITVTINVTDIDEAVTVDPPTTPEVPATNIAPEFLEGDSATRVVLENTQAGVNIGNPVSATDTVGDFLAYTLGGIDADAFDIDSSGQLKTKAPLDYETKRVYTVTITVDDEELSDTITVVISVIDVNDTVISAGFLPVADRTPQVRDAIVAAVPNVTNAADVTESQVAAITSLNLRSKSISSLKTGDFSGMTALTNLNLFRNQLSSLPPGIFNGLTALTTLRLGGNVVDPLPLIVSLQSAGTDAYKAIITTGAPFSIVLPINVTDGSISGGISSVTIPQGSSESASFTVIGTSAKVTFGTLPGLPSNHFGYMLAQSTVCNRTTEVADAIAKAVGVSDCSDVTEVDLATITTLDLSDQSISSLNSGDFDGMVSLRYLYLNNNDLTSLPSDIFADLVSLRELFLNSNKLTNLSSGIFSNLTSLTNLYLQSNDLSSISAGAFDGLSSLRAINLQDNELISLSGGIFDGLSSLSSLLLSNNKLTSLPAGIFEDLTQLSQLHLSWNPDSSSQLSLHVSLEKVGTNQFKAVAPTGAPFAIVLPITVMNGTLAGGATTITIPIGRVESQPLTVTRTAGTTGAVTADIGTPLPTLPATHNGYALVKAATLPLEVLSPLNAPPVFTDGVSTTRSIAENTAAGTNIGAPVSATDQDVNDTLTYTLGGTDAAAFDIDSATGQLKTKVSLNYETKNSYTVTLTVSDGKLTDTITVTINVSNANEAPVFADGSSTTRSIAENIGAGVNIGTQVSATDVDGDTLTYILSGTDATSFDIDSTTGQLKIKSTLDYETKNSYTVTITASDGSLTGSISVTINISNVNEAPKFVDGSRVTRSVTENTATGVEIGDAVAATDPDNDTLTYSLGGTDAASFGIDSETGQLKTKATLDYETKRIYIVTLTVSDGTLTDIITVTINITDIDETIPNRAPIFTAGSTTTRSIAENTHAGVNIGTAVAATDADDNTLIYTLGGTDAASFDIDSETGQLKTKTALDFETRNTYTVIITVSDGTLTDTITVTINITDVVEVPSTPATTTSECVVGDVLEAGESCTYPDTDIEFTVNADGSGQFLFFTAGNSLNIEDTTVNGKSYTLVAQKQSDGTWKIEKIADSSTTEISDESSVNNAPVFLDGSSTSRSIAENTDTGVSIGSAVSATDTDGDTLTYTLSGTDSASFDIDSTTGQLKTEGCLGL